MGLSWHNRRCLVTGAGGFGGSHLCIELIRRGARVFAIDRVMAPSAYLVLEGMSKSVEFIQGDVKDLNLLRLIIERYQIDTIFHLAAQPLVATSNILPFETLDINVSGTYALLEAMRTTQACRAMVFASSGGHYGGTTTDRPISEDDLPCPATNMYGASKTAADFIARAYAQVYGLNIATCRFMNTYGPGDRNFSRIVPRAVHNLLLSDGFDFGDRDDGSTRLDFLYIRDMTLAYIAVAEHIEEVRGEAFNFGSGQAVSTSEIARLVSRAFDGKERTPVFHGASRAQPIVKYLDVSKAERMLGWRPATNVQEGLAQTIDWYRRFINML